MKSFSTYITEFEQDWERMKKPKPQAAVAVDDFGRTMNTPNLPKAEREPREVQPPRKTSSTTQKNIGRLENAPRGTEDRAEFKLRKQYQDPNRINMLPRKIGPDTDPEREQYDTLDTKRDTQDQMPEINVDDRKPKKRMRT